MGAVDTLIQDRLHEFFATLNAAVELRPPRGGNSRRRVVSMSVDGPELNLLEGMPLDEQLPVMYPSCSPTLIRITAP